MSNVLPFNKDAALRAAKAREALLDDIALLKQERALRVSEVRGRLEGQIRKFREDDARRVAENVWRALAEAERSGIKKSKVLEKALVAQPGSSTKHLYRYAVNPELGPEEIKLAHGRITRSTEPYLRIADALASLTKRRDGEVLFELLERTTVLSGTSEAAEGAQESDWADKLSSIVNSICDGITRAENLAAHRERAETYGVVRTDDGRLFAATGERAMLRVSDGDLLTPASAEHFLTFYPHILVGESAVGAPFKVTVTLRGRGMGGAVRTFESEGSTVIEVRLAILPFEPSGVMRAALLVSALTDVSEVWDPVPFKRYSDDADDVFLDTREMVIGGGRLEGYLPAGRTCTRSAGRKGWVDLQSAFQVPETAVRLIPPQTKNGQGTRSGEVEDRIRVLRLTPEAARSVLGLMDAGQVSDWVGPENRRPGFMREEDRRHLPGQGTNLSEEEFHEAEMAREMERQAEHDRRFRHEHDPDPDLLLYAPRGSLARKLERSLLDLPEEDRPDTALHHHARTSVELVREAVNHAITQRKDREASLLRRWVGD